MEQEQSVSDLAYRLKVFRQIGLAKP